MDIVRHENHPRRIVNGVPKPMPIFGTKTGSHNCCSKAARESEFEKFGVGITVYFKFLKYMACIFFLLTILSLPSMVFYFNGTAIPDYSISSIATSLSLGNLGQAQKVCGYAGFTLEGKGKKKLYESSIYLTCPFGTLDGIEVFGQMYSETEPKCARHILPETNDKYKPVEIYPG